MSKQVLCKTFTGASPFEAINAAQAWCQANGLSVGQSCATGPSGLLFGQWDWIAKWRNLTSKERRELHGRIEGDQRHGPVRVVLEAASVQRFRPQLLQILKSEGAAIE